MTPGIATRKMHTNRNLEGVTHLIIDEVHERSVETDTLLLLVKQLIQVNKEIKGTNNLEILSPILFLNAFIGFLTY